jgi:Domain of unknown function (DUF5753)
VLGRQKPPLLTLLVDEAALYRLVGSPEVMAAQLRHLLEIAARPNVVLQVMPEVAHASLASGYLIAEDAVWSEHVISGATYTDLDTVTATTLRFDTLRGECYRVSESLALLERMHETWTGGNRPTRPAAAETA